MPTPEARVPSPDVIREFNDRGTLWLLEDPANLRDLLRIVEPELAERLDFARAERINRSFIPEDLQKRESDLIFAVPFRGERASARSAVWVYVLLEHQSKPDPLMPLRLLFSMVQLWESQRREWAARRTPLRRRRLRPVVPLVFYTGRRAWAAPLRLAALFDIPAQLERFIPSWETLFLNLHDTSPETLVSLAGAVGYALRVFQAEQMSTEDLAQLLSEAMEGLERLSKEEAGQWQRVVWFLVLLIFHRRSEADKIALIEGLRQRARGSKFRLQEELANMEKTYAQVVEERAEARAEAKWRAEGQTQGLRGALETVLTSRFGVLPPEVQAALSGADLDTLDGWLLRAATAETLAEVGIMHQEPRA